MRKDFTSPMLKVERIIGFVYIPLHIIVLPYIAAAAVRLLFPLAGLDENVPASELVWFSFSCVFLFAVMFRFLKASFNDMLDRKGKALQGVVVGLILYFALLYAMAMLLNALSLNIQNPNSEAIHRAAAVNRGAIFTAALILAPIAEELMFRGVLFGSIRRRSRILAYIVSALVFSFYHVWQYFIVSYDPALFINVLQYVPPSIALAYCYERSGSIWPPILLHSVINLIALSA